MKEYLVDAVILKSIKAREADRVITLYTRQMGKKRVMAHGVEKLTSKKRGSVQPFGFSRLLLRSGKDLDSVSQGEGIEIFPILRQSLSGLSKAGYLAELVDSFTVDEDPNTRIFDILLETFRVLGGEFDFVATRAFEIKLVSFLGYSPTLDNCISCGVSVKGEGENVFFLPSQGGILCPKCISESAQSIVLSRGALKNLKALQCWPINRLHQLKISTPAGKEIKKVMKHFIEYYLEKKIKALAFEELIDNGGHGWVK